MAGTEDPSESTAHGHPEVADERRAASPAERPPRNIVLFSDGTGNSAAKLNKTNVWWLYQALDLGGGDQIAIYDDGVGTSGFKPLQLLGGAFGWGLARNVRDLYEFLCRHYRPGDHVYVFGFSRGAFTVRVLAGLIVKCGVLDCSQEIPRRWGEPWQLNTHQGLKAGIRHAYRSYRRGYRAPFTTACRWLWDRCLTRVPLPDDFRRRYSLAGSDQVRFIGVWDTVAAVGLPVDELSTMVDKIFYPHRFRDQSLSPRVEAARHAIAIDDERHSFQPVLWDENGTADSDRIRQVWFAGMHSNVGGGYPDDDLAYVPLLWMIGEASFDDARGFGLRFDRNTLRAIRHRAQALGKMYDSRRGLGVYYRYNPRHVETLCADRENRVRIAEPKIHAAVLERIAENTTGYAPAGLPASYRLVDDRGTVSAPDPADYEGPDQRRERARLLERAQHHVFWRRVIYYLFVFVTLALALMPYYRPAIPGAEPDGFLQNAVSWPVSLLPAVLPGFLGSWSTWWTDAWTQSAGPFLILALIYAWLLRHSRVIDGTIHRLSEVAWSHLKRRGYPGPAEPPVGRFERLARTLRRIGWLHALRRIWIRYLIPGLALLATLWLGLAVAYRLAVHDPALGGGACDQYLLQQPEPAAPNDGGRKILFDTAEPCVDTGIMLQEGRRYEVTMLADQWRDDGYAAAPTGLSGFRYRFDPVYSLFIPTRRRILLPWFTLIAEIGRDSGEVFPLSRPRVTFVPPRSGRLYLYVNDAIDPSAEDIYGYYANNVGTATIEVRLQD